MDHGIIRDPKYKHTCHSHACTQGVEYHDQDRLSNVLIRHFSIAVLPQLSFVDSFLQSADNSHTVNFSAPVHVDVINGFFSEFCEALL